MVIIYDIIANKTGENNNEIPEEKPGLQTSYSHKP